MDTVGGASKNRNSYMFCLTYTCLSALDKLELYLSIQQNMKLFDMPHERRKSGNRPFNKFFTFRSESNYKHLSYVDALHSVYFMYE